MNRSGGDPSGPDATVTMLGRLLDGSLRGLATYHLLEADLQASSHRPRLRPVFAEGMACREERA
jgi:hypothetical protein